MMPSSSRIAVITKMMPRIVAVQQQRMAVAVARVVSISGSSMIQNYTTSASSTRTIEDWSNQLSFTSPESDFCDATHRQMSTTAAAAAPNTSWTNQLSFTSQNQIFVVLLLDKWQQHARLL
jgi:hypothetical protein